MERPARPRYQRARRDAEKAERRRDILATAASLLRTSRFEDFSMGVLARKTGIAKGTLYLYFETREEVLLAVWVEALSAWARDFEGGLTSGMDDRGFAAWFRETARKDPNFLTLRARLESVIEHNVGLEQLVSAKRAMRDLLADLAPRVEETLGLAAGSGGPLLHSLAALLVGHEQSSVGPATTSIELPPDVADFMRLHAETDVFGICAPILIAGLRDRSHDSP